MKKFLIKVRALFKLCLIISTAIFLILAAIIFIYKPIYSVYLNGELIGYCEDKGKLQTKISDFVENGNENIETTNLAFVSIENMPTYSMCLLKRGIVTNDDEIFDTVVKDGVPYYKYYAILDEDEEKVYVSKFETAEEIVAELKKKESNNIEDISIIEKYETELQEFSTLDDAVSELYEKKPTITVAKAVSATVSTARNMSSSKVTLGISLIKPVSGTISSRFGSISSLRSGAHTGLDIAASSGTRIKVASDGVVSFAGVKGAYGNLIVVSHTNSVMTYYGHCSKIYVSVGDRVSQGDVIGAVGSTGNSTGPHLHFEIRVNGVAYNPQYYLY